MSGTIDKHSQITEIREIQGFLRKWGEYRKANMLDFAICSIAREQVLELALRNACEFGIECQAEYGAVDDSEEAILAEMQSYIEQAQEEITNGQNS